MTFNVDHSKPQTVQVFKAHFPFEKKTREYVLFYEYYYVPVCPEEVREELNSHFSSYKFLKDLWGTIDCTYIAGLEFANEVVQRQLKIVPNKEDFVLKEIEKLEQLKLEDYRWFQTDNPEKIDLYGGIEVLMYEEKVEDKESYEELIKRDIKENENSQSFNNLIEITRNLSRLNFIESLKLLLTKLGEKMDSQSLGSKAVSLKLLLNQEEMDCFLDNFKKYFFQDQWGNLYRKIYAISNLDLPQNAPESNSYNNDSRVDFIDKQAILVELFKRLRYHKKITPYKQHKTLADWLYTNFNYKKKKDENVFIKVSERTSEKYLAENERNSSYKENYILKELYPYLPLDKRPKE